MSKSTKDYLITETEAARLCGLKVSSLRSRRFQGKPPAYIKIGRSVRYSPSDIEKWIDSGRIEPQKSDDIK